MKLICWWNNFFLQVFVPDELSNPIHSTASQTVCIFTVENVCNYFELNPFIKVHLGWVLFSLVATKVRVKVIQV